MFLLKAEQEIKNGFFFFFLKAGSEADSPVACL